MISHYSVIQAGTWVFEVHLEPSLLFGLVWGNNKGTNWGKWTITFIYFHTPLGFFGWSKW